MEVYFKNIKSIVLIDQEDLPLFESHVWTLDGDGYVRTAKTPTISLHRLVLKYFGEELQVDHINGNKLDNRKCNLRLCTNMQNSMNTGKVYGYAKNQSKYKGVSWSKQYKKWDSRVVFKGKRYRLGFFDSEIEAAAARDKKLLELVNGDKLFSPFVRLNFPEINGNKNEVPSA